MMVFVYKIPCFVPRNIFHYYRHKIYVYYEKFAFDRASIWIFIAFSNNEILWLNSHTLPPCNCIKYISNWWLMMNPGNVSDRRNKYFWLIALVICNIRLMLQEDIWFALYNNSLLFFAMVINKIIFLHAITYSFSTRKYF